MACIYLTPNRYQMSSLASESFASYQEASKIKHMDVLITCINSLGVHHEGHVLTCTQKEKEKETSVQYNNVQCLITIFFLAQLDPGLSDMWSHLLVNCKSLMQSIVRQSYLCEHDNYLQPTLILNPCQFPNIKLVQAILITFLEDGCG